MDELTATRKIRACEGEAAAQVVLAHYAQAIRHKALEDAAKVCEKERIFDAYRGMTHVARECRESAAAIRALKGDTK